MDLLKIPTDNAYKFQTVVGLVIFVASLLGAVHLVDGHNQRAYALHEEVEVLVAQRDLVKRDGSPSAAIKQKEASLKARQDSLLMELGLVRWYLGVVFIILCSGITAMWTGLRDWKANVQVHEDRILRKRAEAFDGHPEASASPVP